MVSKLIIASLDISSGRKCKMRGNFPVVIQEMISSHVMTVAKNLNTTVSSLYLIFAGSASEVEFASMKPSSAFSLSKGP